MKMRVRYSFTIIFFCIILSGCSVSAQTEYEWPCFHGADRTNKSAETGLLTEWPENGPELLWTVSGLGEGYSTISVGGGHIYTSGIADNMTCIFSFDLDGKHVWHSSNGIPWSTSMSHASTYTGSRSTPTYDNGVVYHLGERGRLAAFESGTGKELWSRELLTLFDAEIPEYGYSESILIDGDNLYVRPAGKKGFQVCLNKNTGELIWSNTVIPGSEGYTSMVLNESEGFRQIVGSSSNCYYGVDTETGKLLWKIDFENQRGLNVTDATVSNDLVFVSSGYGKGSMLVKLNISGPGIVPETVWQSDIMDNHHGGVILHEGYIYGSGSNSRGWFCLDLLTGEQRWKEQGKGSITFAEGMLYLLDERGVMKLVKATPEKFELRGEFKVPRGGDGMFWAHPVVCGGRLYIRHSDKLFAYKIIEK